RVIFQAEDGIRDFHVTGVQTCALPIWKRRLVLSGPPSPANIRVGSSPSRLNGYNPDVNGNSPGTFSCNTQRRISPHASYFGKAILGICKCDNDSECVWILISLSRTMNEYTGFLYLFTFSSQPVMTSQL